MPRRAWLARPDRPRGPRRPAACPRCDTPSVPPRRPRAGDADPVRSEPSDNRSWLLRRTRSGDGGQARRAQPDGVAAPRAAGSRAGLHRVATPRRTARTPGYPADAPQAASRAGHMLSRFTAYLFIEHMFYRRRPTVWIGTSHRGGFDAAGPGPPATEMRS